MSLFLKLETYNDIVIHQPIVLTNNDRGSVSQYNVSCTPVFLIMIQILTIGRNDSNCRQDFEQ